MSVIPDPQWREVGQAEQDHQKCVACVRANVGICYHLDEQHGEGRSEFRYRVPIHVRAICPHELDGTPAIGRAAVIFRDGVKHAHRFCLLCGSAVGQWIPRSKITAAELEGLRVVADLRGVADECVVCHSSEGVQVHHWAPQALFPDADEWPTADLCRECHARWHSVVTPRIALEPIA